MGKQNYEPGVKHSSNQLYHEPDKTRSYDTKDSTIATTVSRFIKWLLKIKESNGED